LFQIGACRDFAQYRAFDPSHPSSFEDRVPPEELGHHPVDGVTWNEAVSFCRWLAWAFSWARGARLPAEEEWEYACRAGTRTRYWNGNGEKHLAEVGWYEKNSEGRTHRVGEKPANAWGLYDVHGNLWEWTLSPWTDSYAGREGGVTHDPIMVNTPERGQDIGKADDQAAAGTEGWESGIGCVMRGGGSRFFPAGARAAYRSHWIPGIENTFQGFRVLLPGGPELRA
jgi:formylglycine-generating enzyme required for sulfatase activity